MSQTVIPPPRYQVEAYEGARGAHLYRAQTDGGGWLEELPSVTKKLDLIGGPKTGALMGWAVKTSVGYVERELSLLQGKEIDSETMARILAAGKKRPERVKDEAADLGTRVHILIDRHISGETDLTMAEDERVAFGNFLSFCTKKKLKFVCGDLAVASRRFRYGGRLDAIARVGNKLVLVDWKTSNAIRDDYALQVAGYRVAFEEMFRIKIAAAMVVRFDKTNPDVLDYRYVSLPQATRAWKALVKFDEVYNGRFWK